MSRLIGNRTDGFTHTVGCHHFSGDFRGTLNIVTSTSGNISKAQLFCDTTAQQSHDLVFHVPFGQIGAVFFRQRNGHTTSPSAGNNGNLTDWVLPRQRMHHQGVTGFVPCSQFPFVLRNDTAFFLRACDDLDFCRAQILHGDEILVLSCRQQCRLVDEIFQIRTSKACRTLCQFFQIHILRQRFIFDVYFEDVLTTSDIRQSHVNLTIETSRAQQGRVKHVCTVGGGQYHYAFIGGETVHFHQKLVQCLFSFVMTATDTRATLTTDRINFVDEYDGRGVLFCLVKQVTDTARTDTHIQLHKVRAGNGQKSDTGFTGHCFGQQRFARTRRANQQDAFGDACAQVDEFFRFFQKLYDFL